jgi:hypothetical protein
MPNMSDFTIVIENDQPDILLLETSFINNIGVIEIEKYDIPSVNIYTGLTNLSLSDIPDIPVSKIIGLAEYLDQYEFDCGTP